MGCVNGALIRTSATVPSSWYRKKHLRVPKNYRSWLCMGSGEEVENSIIVPSDRFVCDSDPDMMSLAGSVANDDFLTTDSKWLSVISREEALSKFSSSLPSNPSSDILALRVYMEETHLLKSLLEFSFETFAKYYFFCWIDIQFFKKLDAKGCDQRRCTALQILENYLNRDSTKFIEMEGVDKFYSTFQKKLSNWTDEVLPSDLFYDLQLHCFMEIYRVIWPSYGKSAVYYECNKVNVDDFEYMDILGAGGFGFVVHARKISTGKHYAMKVQKKANLLEVHRDDPVRVTFERQAMSRCNHPFIIRLDYSFQNCDHVFMAMELGEAGSLHQELKLCGKGGMTEKRTCFYTAEIVLGLVHMHRMGFMYRDLKPSNVIIMANGHIKLVDLGCVIDPNERLLTNNRKNFNFLASPLHSNDGSMDSMDSYLADFEWRLEEMQSREEGVTEIDALASLSSTGMRHSDGGSGLHSSHRQVHSGTSRSRGASFDRVSTTLEAHTFVGTNGYMAPEMFHQHDSDRGMPLYYTEGIDFWALGVTMAELLIGTCPFRGIDPSEFRENRVPKLYKRLFNILDARSDVSDECIQIIRELLELDKNFRLGAGPRGSKNIRNHPFFDEIDWNKLGLLQVKPPVMPSYSVYDNSVGTVYSCFQDVLNMNERKMSREMISASDDKYYESWDYVAPDVIKLELGVQSS